MDDMDENVSAAFVQKCYFCRQFLLGIGDGIPLSKANKERLSKWWNLNIGSPFYQDTISLSWCCKNCIEDARFYHKHTKGSYDLIWWPQQSKESELIDSTSRLEPVVEIKRLSPEVEPVEDLPAPPEPDVQQTPNRKRGRPTKMSAEVTPKFEPNDPSASTQPDNVDAPKKKKRQGPPAKQKSTLSWLKVKLVDTNVNNTAPVQIIETEPTVVDPEVNDKESTGNVSFKKGHTFKCNYCDAEFNSSKQTLSHSKQKHPLHFIQCPVEKCKRSFTIPENLVLHINNKHNNEIIDDKGMFTCPHCSSKHINMKAVKKHVKKIHPEHYFKCSMGCNYCFIGKAELERHLKTHHAYVKIYQKNPPEENQRVTRSITKEVPPPPMVPAEAIEPKAVSDEKPPVFADLGMKKFVDYSFVEEDPYDDDVQCLLCKFWNKRSRMPQHRMEAACPFCKKWYACVGMRNKHVWVGCSEDKKKPEDEGKLIATFKFNL
ncbi:GDNF-inducible zinc finger protein 1-like [Neocloeon triangulifer]|uniref:GDNF-inducible zinc finger protein 1-like n=1 Tax=Neocloeon triangulifer TaxID=2078957 RepID=UPI00286F13D7|nr:GDNF-inducible zinc finger protein 1-like [Neocloeon triangulifer]